MPNYRASYAQNENEYMYYKYVCIHVPYVCMYCIYAYNYYTL